MITVTDSGPGLTPEQIQSMFQEGVQFNATELQQGQGSGLGLWISREILKQHQGVIAVTSEGLGKGSTFVVSFPIMTPSPKCVAERSVSMRSGAWRFIESPNGNAASVPSRALVVDDAVSNRKILSKLLEGAGVRVEQAENGHDCVIAVETCDPADPFDVIIMDYQMPVLTGPEASQKIRDLGFNLPIIGVTGNVLPEDIDHFKMCGADVVLLKPVSLSTLLEAYTMIKRAETVMTGSFGAEKV